jgi:hypothetical protein
LIYYSLSDDDVRCSDSREIAMGIATRISGLAQRSQDRAVLNAREATTALSRLRVEREEVELYLRGRSTSPTPAAASRAAAVRRPA